MVRKVLSILLSMVLILALSASSAEAQAEYKRGVEYYQQRNYRAAIQCFETAVQRNAGDQNAYYYEALSYQQLGDLPHATQLYSTITSKFPGSQAAQLSTQALQRLPAASTTFEHLTRDSRSAFVQPRRRGVASMNASEEEWVALPDEAKVPFRRSTGGNLFVQVSVNNRPMEVVFDSGASTCTFSKTSLEAAGIRVKPEGPVTAMHGVGSAEVPCYPMVIDLELGPIKRHMPVMVAEAQIPPLLGQTFFNAYQWMIDNQAGSIHFVKKGRYGSATANTRHDDPVDTINIPFTVSGNNLVVRAMVNGHPCSMFFDTGAEGMCFSYEAAMMCGIDIDKSRVIANRGVGGTAFGYEGTVDRIELGSVLKTNMQVTVLVQGAPALPLLGQPFFRDKRFTIDNERHLIKFVH